MNDEKKYYAGLDIGFCLHQGGHRGRRGHDRFRPDSVGGNYKDAAKKSWTWRCCRQACPLTACPDWSSRAGAESCSLPARQVSDISRCARAVTAFFLRRDDHRHRRPVHQGGQNHARRLDRGFPHEAKMRNRPGRFLQVIARILSVPLDEIGLAAAVRCRWSFPPTARFVESETISRIAEGKAR